MSMLSRLCSLWRNTVRRGRVERDLNDEVNACVAMLEEEKMHAGLAPDAARRQARLELGRPESIAEQVRIVRAGAWLESLLLDVRYSIRTLRRTPGFSAIVVLTLALGIGVNIAVFTLLDAVILKPLPVPAPGELVTLYENGPEGTADATGGTGRFLRFSYRRFERLQRALGAHGSLAAVTRNGRFVLRLPGKAAVPVSGQLVSGEYFATLGVSAASGRVLTPTDMRTDHTDAAVVISDGCWKRLFGAAADAIGQVFMVNGVSVTVVGIAPERFNGMWTDSAPDLWLPLTLQTPLGYRNNSSSYSSPDESRPWMEQDSIAWLNVVGRIRERELPQARALLEVANRQGVVSLSELMDAPSRPGMLRHSLAVVPFAHGFSIVRGQFTDTLVVLSVIVAAVLLVTCLNVANLMLARAAGRARDVSIRLSLGATRWRLIRHSLIESVVLAGAGGTAGWFAAEWASEMLARQALGTTRDLPPIFSPDLRVLLFAVAVSAGTAVFFGLLPALRATSPRRHAIAVTTQRQQNGDVSTRGMRPLVAAQLALSLTIVFAAVLLSRTLINYSRIDPGFDGDHLLAVSYDAITSGYPRNQGSVFAERLVAAVQAVPAVRAAAVSACGLLVNCTYSSSFRFDATGPPVPARRNWVTAGYFATAGIPLLAGREFDRRDTANSAPVAIITESIARRFFAGQDALGRHVGSDKVDAEIVGVVRDVRSVTVREPPVPMIYFPLAQPPAAFVPVPTSLDIRVEGDPADAVQTIRDGLRRAEPGLIVDGVVPLSTRFSRDLARQRLIAYLSSAFGVLTLLLAVLGLYGVLSYMVARRTREIGVRMALGARWSEVMALVLRQAAGVIVAGSIGGFLLTLAAARMLKALLFGVSVWAPATYLSVSLVLAASALAAAYAPARRAALIDPVRALRTE